MGIKKYRVTDGPDKGQIKQQSFGPKPFGALFSSLRGFMDFTYSQGLILAIIAINAAKLDCMPPEKWIWNGRKDRFMWHFVDLVWYLYSWYSIYFKPILVEIIFWLF